MQAETILQEIVQKLKLMSVTAASEKSPHPGSADQKAYVSSMKITSEGLTFYTLKDFDIFLRDYNLMGQITLSEPILDNNGNILYKDQIPVKESVIKRLEEMPGQFKSLFRVPLNQQLIRSLERWISSRALQELNHNQNMFIVRLYESTRHPYANYIRHALHGNTSLTLTLFKVSREKKKFFDHIIQLALLTLGILIQKGYRIRYINRNAFLAGLASDLALSSTNFWKVPPDDDAARKNLAKQCADLAGRFRLAPEIVSAIERHFVIAGEPVLNEPVIDSSLVSLSNSYFDEFLHEEGPEDEGDEKGGSADTRLNSASDATYSQAKLLITESLKLAKYITTTISRIEDKDHYAEELVYMISYNASKGYFHKDIILPILRQFREFEIEARRIMKIAEIENKCIHPPSAWAYPKPRASQVLCRLNMNECPKLEAGWDMHVVSRQQAVGWIGANLEPGVYSKCSLESELEGLEKMKLEIKDKNLLGSDENKKPEPVQETAPVTEES